VGRKAASRERILSIAVDKASLEGLGGLSVGDLASAAGMSKSGLFAHFGSKEAMEAAIVEGMAARFMAAVWQPNRHLPHGAERLKAVVAAWRDWMDGKCTPGGCPMMAALTELDDKPGPARDLLVQNQNGWYGLLAREFAFARGKDHAEACDRDKAFALYGLMSSFTLAKRMLNDPDADGRLNRSLDALLA